ncbi:putative small intestine urate exporter, partial [Galemys pyrenaicus]
TPVYDWNTEIQGIILSSINNGSFLAPIPVGYVAGIFGAKYVVGIGLLISSVLTLFTPLAADAGVTLLIVLCILQRHSLGTKIFAKYEWNIYKLPRESVAHTLALSGIGCSCSFLWFLLVFEDPMNHPFISTGEKEYIMASLTEQSSFPGCSVPIKAMVTSLPLWAILVSGFCIYWCNNIMATYMPTYIKTVLEVNIRY